jgi:S1-C subfamily serine protease
VQKIRYSAALAAVTMLAAAATAAGQSADERTAARDVAARRSDAVITVMGTLKATMSRGGRDQPAPDQAVQASATVLDPDGLTVVSLSAIDPGALLAKNPAFAAAKVSIETELTDVKLRLADATEVPAKIVLRDSDLDLLFVRPTDAPSKPMPCVDSASPTFNAVDPVIAVQRLQELAGWRTATALGNVEAVVDKPRRFYLVALMTTFNGLGASIFDVKGQFAGVVTLRPSTDSRHNALNGMQGGMLQALGMVPVVLPAADIREVAKQVAAR